MPLYLTEDDVVATLPMSDALRLVEGAARALADEKAMNAPRQRVRTQGAILQVLPASLDGRMGLKTYTVAPRGPRFWVTLFNAEGEMLALIEADRLGQIRTGAASGVATRSMARKDATVLGVIGTGYQARTQVEAVCAVRPIQAVRAYGRDRARLERFCAEMTARTGIAVTPAASGEAAVADADVVVTMTNAAKPVLEGRWLKAGAHVNAAGSNRGNAQEIDVETVRRAALIAVEDVAQAKVESGDLRAASEAGAFTWLDAVRLSDIVAGAVVGRTADDQITLFESLGIGLWDVAAASHVYDAARVQGRGTELPIPG